MFSNGNGIWAVLSTVTVVSTIIVASAAASEAPAVLTPLELARVWMRAGGSHELCPIAVAVALRDSGVRRPASPFGLQCDRRRSSRRGLEMLGLWSVHSTALEATCALDCDCSTKYAVTALAKDWTPMNVNLALRTADIVTANGACSGWQFVSLWNEGKSMLRGMWAGISILFALLRRIGSLAWWCISKLGYTLVRILSLVWGAFEWGILFPVWVVVRWSAGVLWSTVCVLWSTVWSICRNDATIPMLTAVSWIILIAGAVYILLRKNKIRRLARNATSSKAFSKSLEWQDEYGNWNLLDQASMAKVDRAAAQGRSSVSVTPPNNQTYDLDFSTTRMTQTNRKYKTVKSLRWVATPRTPTSSAAAAARNESPPPTVHGVEAQQLAAWAPFRQAIDAQAASPNVYYRCEPKDTDPQIRALYTYAVNQFQKTCGSRKWQIVAVDLCIHPIKVADSSVSFHTPF